MSRRAWVEQVMGMPVSIHLRGPHVREADGGAGRRRRLRRAASGSTRSSRPTVPKSALSRRRRGDLAAGSDDPLFAEVEELCEVAAERTAGRSRAWLPDADGVVRYDPTGLVKGWAVDRAARELTGLPGDLVVPSTPAVTSSSAGTATSRRRARTRRRGGSASRTRATARGWSPSCR